MYYPDTKNSKWLVHQRCFDTLGFCCEMKHQLNIVHNVFVWS